MSETQRRAVENMIRSAPGFLTASFEDMRAAYEEMGGITPPDPQIKYSHASAHGVPLEIGLAPDSSRDRNILYFHGGGYIIGSAVSHRGVVALLGQATQAQTLFIEYRRAPEHPFPVPLDDALTAYKWLLQSGASPERIAFAGDSAGGGMAVATLVRARDAGLPMPAAVAVLSPLVDLAGTGASMVDKASQDLTVNRAVFDRMTQAYLAGVDPKTPLASPIYADLRLLPPMLIQVGSAEMLLDDAIRLMRQAVMANVEVELQAEPHVQHFWHIFAGILDEGGAALRHAGEFLRRHMDRPKSP